MLFLWTGPKHGGKTTGAGQLVAAARQRGFRVAGLLAPSVYRKGHLAGFDAWDLRSDARAPLAVRRSDAQRPSGPRPGDVGPFHFLPEGCRLGRQALAVTSVDGADLAIVDEFGPLELAGRGWRAAADALIHAANVPLVLIVRREMAEAVRKIYADVPSRVLDGTMPASVAEVLHGLQRPSGPGAGQGTE